MLPEPARPGSTPIITVDGATIVYRVWIAGVNGRCEMLVIRCTSGGDVYASIGDNRTV
ncbi:MAG TPA: hypothetical protein VFB07_12690 [Vicinamibacterales bacterium]|nr:hypothetical protein [Vicinamibacterales bacterium]